MDNVAIVVQDLDAAIQFFAELGLVLEGRMQVEGDWVDRVVGLTGVRSEIAMMRTPDGHCRLELTKYHAASGSDRPDVAGVRLLFEAPTAGAISLTLVRVALSVLWLWYLLRRPVRDAFHRLAAKAAAS
jgi:catechol 2,3-dioxygenase-like lactoylglutathione lyase family enzyme